MAGDARNKLISKHRQSMGDARDRLAMMAKKTDARDKLKKIRNLKQGKVSRNDIDVKFASLTYVCFPV